ncbi:MAG: protein kinase [Gammaproteobacteria bacterium]|jgi:serine/threonine protein kinase|nr:protein kinase [Gammaproteobacteria bacterium]MDH3983949.1 protein kinase [Gammaproteobacteria bacterium]
MSPESEKIRDALAEQLASFDRKLHATASDVDMLTDIQEAIGSLLTSSGSSEAEIRRVLQERYDAGELRKETFQLVKSMLDRFISERVPTADVPQSRVPEPARPIPPVEPAARAVPAATNDSDDDQFGATTVIPVDALPANDSADSLVQPGSVLRDRFLLQKKVSGGSMGVVYKALDRRLAEAGADQTSVAIKVLSPQLAANGHALRALQQEASKTRCLVHPNIVRFIDLDRDDELYFLILEWLEGRTLADILDSADARSIDSDAAFRIVRQIGDALDYAHRCGIVHADIKPGNIMIMPNGDAKLFDFGVARVRQQQADGDFDPGVLGALTPAYSSMQVLGGEDPVATDDVFSLGCLLYRLVAGYRVFGPRNAAEASLAGMTPQRPQGLNDGQWKALKRALSYSRVTRFQSVREFTDALAESDEETISFEAPERFPAEDNDTSPGKWIALIVILLGLAGIGAQQLGYLDPWLEKFLPTDEIIEVGPPEEIVEEFIAEPALATPDEVTEALVPGDPVAEEPGGTDEQSAVVSEEPAVDVDIPKPEVRAADLVDFSTLPPPSAIVNFSVDGPVGAPTNVVLLEDADPVIVDFIRDGDLATALTLRLEEIGFSGNRSPWASGQYALSNSGLVVFPVGQHRARIVLRAASDPRREADQQSTLRLRLADTAESELAIIDVSLQDDDQRKFEERLPANTVAFATSQVSVSEADPAVQIDIIRFNPDNTSMVVEFRVEDLTATEGEDYFAPGSHSISFGPGQRSARLLIPLVQDAIGEGDEAFAVKLLVDNETRPAGVSPNIAIMIRDDEL